MALVKWGLFFIVSFLASFVLITTFSQDAFSAAVPVKVIFYQTQNIPIYYFILAAFVSGLLIGLFMAFYNFITLSSRAHKKDKRIRELENEISILRHAEVKPEKKDESADKIDSAVS